MRAAEQQVKKRQSKRKRNALELAERSFLADQLDWAPTAYSDPPIEPIDADGVIAVHNASMRVLEDIGVLFLNDAALAAIALLQSVREGAPVMYGAFTSNVDMKTGAPAFGTPEFVRAMQISGQMARHYNLPFRASNANAANAPDAQAVWESAFSLQGSCSGGANLIYHAAGWMEGGLSASFEKFVIDCEMLQQIIYAQRPIIVDEASLAVSAIAEVGPHGHFFGCDHTQERYRDAFYTPLLSDWRNFENWEDAGGLWAHQRANTHFKQVLAEYTPPPMDRGIHDELLDFVNRRKAEGGAPTDF